MKIALVSNPFSYEAHEENLKTVQRFFGLFPPLSLAWVAAIAEESGHRAIIIDARTLGLSMQQTAELLKEFKPDLIGFTITTYAYRETLSWIKYIKKEVGGPIAVGGFGVGLYPQETLLPEEIDYGFVGQVNRSLPALLDQLSGEKDFSKIPGLIYKEQGVIKFNPKEEAAFDFDKLPFPARHLLPNELYSSFPTKKHNFTVMVTSFGCPHRCIFCNVALQPYAPRSVEVVLREIEECYHKHDVREIDFFDYEFTVLRARVMQICKGIIEKKLDISWSCRSRVDSVDEELLSCMKAAGCSRIYYGIESGDQQILDNLKKDITVSRIKETIQLTQKRGIKTLGFFMFGSPGETQESIHATIQFAKELNLDFVQFARFTAKPGTLIYENMSRQDEADYWKEFVLGKAEAKALDRPWTELGTDEIDAAVRRAYLSFYSRPAFLFRALWEVKTIRELKRKAFAFLEMLFNRQVVGDKEASFDIYRDVGKERLASGLAALQEKIRGCS
jgi:radical SAM superfamily enzyme YgiQ (UPF0313 family)